ncbi:efflux RND transporter periplasmic adaptor subunit [Acidisoma silvae]|uniref:Efflux RND transporter periplasmic adaptor subunit n=1 Tax=Acidisoma silvae TaxID=2802396 RepID=A0A963YSS4_9PROT|nr:efflux RND transporter periplasmic adaptor subunit [Acidisoma silvae]MCB8876054.1 efflux RND transporter periplasmic adaptor subunit [Acidisoma silvae]
MTDTQHKRFEIHPGPAGRRSTAKRLAAAVVLIGAGAGAWWYWANTPSAPAPHATAGGLTIPVIAGAASTRDLPVWLSGIGTVTPLNKVDVKVRVDGQLQQLFFTEGQDVTAGQLLAQIDPRPYQAVLAQAEATRQRDLAQSVNAQQEVVRAQKLASAGAGTSQNLDTMKAQQAALKATLDSDEAAIDAAQLNLDFTRVTSPLAGRVGLRQIDAGSIVHATDTTGLVTVTEMAPISVLFSLPQSELADVAAGQHKGDLPVAIDSRDGTQHIADGKLIFIDSSVDQSNGEIQLKAVFTNTDRVLWPGEFVSARVLVRTDRHAVTVPAQAVLTGQNGLYVYVVKPDDTVTPQTVVTGPTVTGFTEIRSGLQPGQQVVLDGQSRLAPGTHVTVAPDAPAGGGSGT